MHDIGSTICGFLSRKIMKIIAKYPELLELFSQLRVTGHLDDLSSIIDEATNKTSLNGKPRLNVEGFGFLPIAWSMGDWYVMRFDRRYAIYGYYRDTVDKPVFYVRPRKPKPVLDLFGAPNAS